MWRERVISKDFGFSFSGFFVWMPGFLSFVSAIDQGSKGRENNVGWRACVRG